MAQQTRDTIKAWFETGDYPTQQQFWDLIDSCLNLLDDQIPINNIQGLTEALQNKADASEVQNVGNLKETIVYIQDGTYTIPAGLKLESIIVISTQDLPAFHVGRSQGVADVVPVDPDPLAAGKAHEIFLNIYAIADTILYLEGLLPNTTIIFYKR